MLSELVATTNYSIGPITTHRYFKREDAEDCMRYINGTRLDDRVVRTDWDAGFEEGRQFGRGKTGGQVLHAFHATSHQPPAT